jgi:cephalosporin hydroxylase
MKCIYPPKLSSFDVRGRDMVQDTKMILHDNKLVVQTGNEQREVSIYSEEGFNLLTRLWVKSGWNLRYSYSFTWMGRPIIQLPEDVLVVQELIFMLQPNIIIETGVAHGGSLILYASLCKALEKGRVIGVDIEIRPHNRKAIEEHPLFPWITLIEGDSVAPEIVGQVRALIRPEDNVLVLLDSNHSKSHVLAELKAYAPFVTVGSYIVATDGIMQEIADTPHGQPTWEWDNPQTAAKEFVSQNPSFVIERPPLLFNESTTSIRPTYWPNGFLKRVK